MADEKKDERTSGANTSGGRPPRRNDAGRRKVEDDGLIKKTIQVNRISKTVKGGRRMRFSALVVVGDGKGNVGIGMGKSREVSIAAEKATAKAKREMRKVNISNTTIPHTVTGVYGKGSVLMMPASEGTGVIAGGPVRAVMEAVGIKDIRTKSNGTTNPVNCVKATIQGLYSLKSPEEVARNRGKSVEEILD